MRAIVLGGIKLIAEKGDNTLSPRRTYPRPTTPSPAIWGERVWSFSEGDPTAQNFRKAQMTRDRTAGRSGRAQLSHSVHIPKPCSDCAVRRLRVRPHTIMFYQ